MQLLHPKTILVAIASSALLAPGAHLAAKGLDDLKPGVEQPEQPQDKSSTESPEPAQGQVQKTDKSPETGKEKPEEAKKEEKKPEPSKASKALADKLLIGTSFGWIRLSSDKGDWHASGTSDIKAAYRVLTLMKDKLKVFGSFRYLPADVVVKDQGQEFRGVMEAYLFGGYANYAVKSFNIIGGAELGLNTSSLKPIDSYVNELDLAQSGASFVLHGGAQWTIKEKLEVGPTIALGFGTFGSTQFAANVNLKF